MESPANDLDTFDLTLEQWDTLFGGRHIYPTTSFTGKFMYKIQGDIVYKTTKKLFRKEEITREKDSCVHVYEDVLSGRGDYSYLSAIEEPLAKSLFEYCKERVRLEKLNIKRERISKAKDKFKEAGVI